MSDLHAYDEPMESNGQSEKLMHEFFSRESGLSDEVFSRALLVVGLLPPSMARRENLPDTTELAELLVSQWQRLHGRAWPWRLREGTQQLVRGQLDAHHLAKAADKFLGITTNDWSNGGRGLRVEVNVPDPWDPIALYGTVRRGGAHSAFVRRRDEGDLTWSWPLRIGVADTSKLLASIGLESPLRPLFQQFDFKAPTRANLLLFDASLSEATATIGRTLYPFSTDAVIIFGGIGTINTSLQSMLSVIWELTHAQGVFIFDALPSDRAEIATQGLLAYLSHDLPLDSAAARVATEHDVSMLALATRSLVEATSVREQGRKLARRLQKMPGDTLVRVGSRSVSELGGDALAMPTSRLVRAKDLGAALEKRLPSTGEAEFIKRTSGEPEPLSFDRESHGARTLADLADRAAIASDEDAARREPRHLQARVETPAGRAIKGKARMVRSREYSACVFIGARDVTWLGLDQPLPTPEPPVDGPLMLDVLFWEPTVSPKPQLSQLALPPRGNTGVVTFSFQTTADQSVFSARIAIYHQNRNLQTGLLTGRVGDEPAALKFILDAAPVPRFAGLADRAGVSASIIVNDDPSGKMQATAYQNGEASVTSIPVDVQAKDLDQLTKTLGNAISGITTNPDDYKDLSNNGSRQLLLGLAQHGWSILNYLRKYSQMSSHFDQLGYIQIVMAHPNAFLPVEYFYDGAVPKDTAEVCRGRQQVATETLPLGTCCGAYESDPSQTICPLRFWSLSKVIERHAHLPEPSATSGQFQLRSAGLSARNRLLDPLNCAVLAASQQADKGLPGTVAKLRTDLEAVLRSRPVPLATTWESWTEGIKNTKANLLVLLPHHIQEGGFDLLEIGGDKCKSMLIGPEHVRSDPSARPIVLLLGCQTNAAKIDLEGFVRFFQEAGAAIIVSTIASVLGRDAGPAAAAIAQEIKKQERNPDATFGEVMLAVRRRLLAEMPMVLALTSYGDADWRIGAPDPTPVH